MPWAGPGAARLATTAQILGRFRGTPVAGSTAPGDECTGPRARTANVLPVAHRGAMSSVAARGLPSVTEVRVHNFSVSLDGYGAGPGQGLEQPLGAGGEQLHEWIFSSAAAEVDRRFRALGDQDVGATIME